MLLMSFFVDKNAAEVSLSIPHPAIIFMENVNSRNIKSEFLSLCLACELIFLVSEQGV